MKETNASQSGIANPRTILAGAFFCVATLLTYFGLAASPASQMTAKKTSGLSPAQAQGTAVAVPRPRFMNYLSPPGIGDSAGEPSIGSNWTKEQIFTNHNVNGSTNSIPNGGSTLYFGGFLP